MSAAKAKSINTATEMELQSLVPDCVSYLGSLPDDIVLEILKRYGVRNVECLRLISPNWNRVVLAFLDDRHNHPSLDIVRIDGGIAQFHTMNVIVTLDLADKEEEHYDCVLKRWPEQSRKSVHVEPKTFAKKFTFQTPTLMIGVDKLKTFFTITYALIALFVAFRVHIYVGIPLLVIIVAVFAWLRFTVKPAVRVNQLRLCRIFGRSSRIEALVLLNMDEKTFKIIRETLDDVPIRNLLIVDSRCDSHLRQQIVEMTRKHKIDKVTVCVNTCKEKNLRQFFVDTIESATALCIYEKGSKADTTFGQPREFWEEKAREMSDGSISMQVMNGEPLDNNLSEYKLRLAIGPGFSPLCPCIA